MSGRLQQPPTPPSGRLAPGAGPSAGPGPTSPDPTPPATPSSPGTTADLGGWVDPDAGLDQALWAARAGDQNGFIALYQGLQPRLHRYARALVGQDADDVTAEAWLHIARDLPTFSGGLDGFRGWTAAITRHRALDHLRATSRRRADAVGLEVLPDLADLSANGATAESALTALSTAQAVELIVSLPAHQAEAVLLRGVVGLSAVAAGEVLGRSAGAVRVAAHRGLRRLAEQLRAQGVETPGDLS